MSAPPQTGDVFSAGDTVRYRFPTPTNELVMDRAEAETSEAFMLALGPVYLSVDCFPGGRRAAEPTSDKVRQT